MSLVAVKITTDLPKLRKEIENLSKRIPVEIARGLNEAGDKVRTQVYRGLQKQTSLVRYNSVTSRARTIRAFAVSPVYQIIVTGKPTKITEFQYSIRTGPGGGVTAKMWGIDRLFARSFLKVGGAFVGPRARVDEARYPIRSFDGPNLAKEVGKGEEPRIFYASAAELVRPIVEKRLARLLAGNF